MWQPSNLLRSAFSQNARPIKITKVATSLAKELSFTISPPRVPVGLPMATRFPQDGELFLSNHPFAFSPSATTRRSVPQPEGRAQGISGQPTYRWEYISWPVPIAKWQRLAQRRPRPRISARRNLGHWVRSVGLQSRTEWRNRTLPNRARFPVDEGRSSAYLPNPDPTGRERRRGNGIFPQSGGNR